MYVLVSITVFVRNDSAKVRVSQKIHLALWQEVLIYWNFFSAYSTFNKKSFLHQWSINLCAEDVQNIYESDGLIGLQLDLKRLCGKDISKFAEKDNALTIKIIVANILTIVKYASQNISAASNKHKAWNIITIGSDNDGMVNAIKNFPTSEETPVLLNEISKFLENPTDITNPCDGNTVIFTKVEIETLKFGLTHTEITNGISSENALNFLKRYYTNFYLLK